MTIADLAPITLMPPPDLCAGVGHNDLFFAAEDQIDLAVTAFLRQF